MYKLIWLLRRFGRDCKVKTNEKIISDILIFQENEFYSWNTEYPSEKRRNDFKSNTFYAKEGEPTCQPSSRKTAGANWDIERTINKNEDWSGVNIYKSQFFLRFEKKDRRIQEKVRKWIYRAKHNEENLMSRWVLSFIFCLFYHVKDCNCVEIDWTKFIIRTNLACLIFAFPLPAPSTKYYFISVYVPFPPSSKV